MNADRGAHTISNHSPMPGTKKLREPIKSMSRQNRITSYNVCYTKLLRANYGQLCADFGNTNYNWVNPTYDDYKLLSYHVGIAMDMNYCGSSFGSAPYNWGYEKAMHTYFKYYLNNGSTESYFICNEIDNRRPVYIELPGVPGHALVVDGYDSVITSYSIHYTKLYEIAHCFCNCDSGFGSGFSVNSF